MPKGKTPKVVGPPLLNGVVTAATRLGISKEKCYLLIKSGQLRAVKLGRRTLIPEDELDRFVARLEDAAR
jgi:excisionase family DNA binding protein